MTRLKAELPIIGPRKVILVIISAKNRLIAMEKAKTAILPSRSDKELVATFSTPIPLGQGFISYHIKQIFYKLAAYIYRTSSLASHVKIRFILIESKHTWIIILDYALLISLPQIYPLSISKNWS